MQRSAMVSLGLVLAIPAYAQHPFAASTSYDAAVPAPRSVLGYEVGERFTPHHLLMRYAERVAAASKRVRLDTMAVTTEGREALLAIITSEANQRRLDAIRQDAARVAAGGAEANAAAARLPAIVWLAYTVHGNEASGAEAAIAMLYQLAAGSDAETRLVLDSTIVLIDPVQNPDGHERHVQDVLRRLSPLGAVTTPGALVYGSNWPGARTSHWHFDLNRDWFIQSHPETRGRTTTFLEWWPHVAVDLHEMGSNSSYFFAPPMEPVNKNVHQSIRDWWDIYGEANARAFDRHGWSFFRREGYDEFYPGYGVSWPILTGAVGMTFEQASSGPGAIRRSDGTVLTLKEAAWHHYTAAWATTTTTARRRSERVRDYLSFRRSAVSDPPRDGVRGVAIARDTEGRADSLFRILQGNRITVQRLRADASVRGTPYGGSQPAAASLPQGGYLVDYAQPQGRLARALLEPDAELDSTFIRDELERRRTAQPSRFYDITAWSLPLAFRLPAWSLPVLPTGAEPAGELPRRLVEVLRASYGYAFAPGSEASLRMLAGLLRDSVKVWFAPKAFRIGSAAFPKGAFVVRVSANDTTVHERVRRLSATTDARVSSLQSGMADDGTDLGSNSVFYLRPPRIGLVGGQPISGNSFGFAMFAFDNRLGYPVVPIDAANLGGGSAVLDEVNVLVVPSTQAAAFDRVLGDQGRTRLADWVRNGGTLITLEGATGWLATERLGLARIRVRSDSVRADSAGGAPLPAGVPGAIARTTADTLSPLLAGIGAELPVLVNGGLVLTVPRNLRAGEAVVRYAPKDRLRLSGYFWPEVPERLAGSPYLWTESVGRGRLIGFAGDPNFRDIWRGLLPLFANAVLLGGSM